MCTYFGDGKNGSSYVIVLFELSIQSLGESTTVFNLDIIINYFLSTVPVPLGGRHVVQIALQWSKLLAKKYSCTMMSDYMYYTKCTSCTMENFTRVTFIIVTLNMSNVSYYKHIINKMYIVQYHIVKCNNVHNFMQ